MSGLIARRHYAARTTWIISFPGRFTPWILATTLFSSTIPAAQQKSSRMAAGDHLERWLRRNADHGDELGARFDASGVIQKLSASLEIAEWAYSRACASGAMAWQQRNELKQVDSSWLDFFNVARPGL